MYAGCAGKTVILKRVPYLSALEAYLIPDAVTDVNYMWLHTDDKALYKSSFTFTLSYLTLFYLYLTFTFVLFVLCRTQCINVLQY